jgi:c-di-GMP-binding flagellar brake protein YcgR
MLWGMTPGANMLEILHETGKRGGNMGFLNRREHARVQVDLNMVLGEDLELDGTDSLLSDLSLGGCSIKTRASKPEGTVISMQFKLPGMKNLIASRAIVKWIRPLDEPGLNLVGVMFTDISQADLVELKRFVEKRITEELFS